MSGPRIHIEVGRELRRVAGEVSVRTVSVRQGSRSVSAECYFSVVNGGAHFTADTQAALSDSDREFLVGLLDRKSPHQLARMLP